MAKAKDLVLDEYEDDGFEYEFDYDYGKDNSNFIEDYDEGTYSNYEAKSKENNTVKKSDKKEVSLEVNGSFVSILSSCSNWFSILGIGIAIVLILVFIFTLQFKSLVLYLMTLILSFFFGYGFMYLLDYFTSNN